MNTTAPHFNRMFGRAAGLTNKEAADFGPAAYIEAVARRDDATLAKFREVSELVRAAHGRPTDNMAFVAIAPEALVGVQQRGMTAAGVSGSGYLVGTELPVIAETLRSRSLVGRLPLTIVDMTGDVHIPRLGAATTGWLDGEAAQSVEANITITAASATPKYAAARFTVSSQFARQIGEAGRRALDTEVALGVDGALSAAIIAGSGLGGQPQGVVGTAGVASQSGTGIAWPAIAALQAGVDAYDTGDCAWIIGPTAAGVLRARTREAGSGRFVLDDGTTVAGKPAIVHASVPTSTAVVGCWSRLALAVWGPLEIAVDPFSSFATGKISVAVRQAMDVVVLSAGAFGKAEAIT